MLTRQMITECREDQKETLQAIQYSIRHMQLLVMNLTDYQSSQNNLLVLNEKHFVVMDILTHIIEIHDIEAKQNKVTIIYEKGIDDEHEIVIDGERVTQILQNIIRRVLDLVTMKSKIVISAQLK